MELFTVIQNQYMFKKVAWSILVRKEIFKQYKKEVEKQISYLESERFQQISYQDIKILIKYIYNSFQNILKNILAIEKETREVHNIEQVQHEQMLERQFIKNFRRLLICLKENVLFIFPKQIETEGYPNYIVPYLKTDTCEDVFFKYQSKFFNRRLCGPFKPLFEKAWLKSLLTSKKSQRN